MKKILAWLTVLTVNVSMMPMPTVAAATATDASTASNEETTTFIYDLLEQNRNLTQFLEFEILESEEISDFSDVSKFISGIRKFDCINR